MRPHIGVCAALHLFIWRRGERLCNTFATLGQQTQVRQQTVTLDNGPVTEYSALPPPPIVYVAAALASGMLAVQAFLAVRFLSSVQAYRAGVRSGEWAMPRAADCWRARSTEVPAPILPRQLEMRAAYLTRRFAPHSPLWQFTIWLRQSLLFTIGISLKLVLSTLDGLGTPTPSRTARYSLAAAAAVTIAAAWVAHSRVRPYAYTAQNALEWWLFLADLLLLGVAILNSIVTCMAIPKCLYQSHLSAHVAT